MIKKKRNEITIHQAQPQSIDENDSSSDQEKQINCHENLNNNLLQKAQELKSDNCTCVCTKCSGYIKKNQNVDVDSQQRKKHKRREYKKRQKIKIQQQKQKALKELCQIISDIYLLKTDAKKQRKRIENCLQLIQKNENRFYEFINAVIRQQVQTIKKQIRVCLAELGAETPNFAKVPILYEQFLKVKDASPEVQFIINYFIKLISQKNKEPPSYHRDLDKKTFKFLLISDMQNRNNLLKVINHIEKKNIKQERQSQMLRIMIEMIRQKNIQSDYSDSQQDQSDQSSDRSERSEYDQESDPITNAQTKTKASRKYDSDDFYQNSNSNVNKKNPNRRRRKNKNVRVYEVSFQRTLESLIQLEKSLNWKQQQKYPCNIDEDWLLKFRLKHLSKSQIN